MSIPTSAAGHGPDTVMPWLSNLLPDAEEVRSRWAAKFHERRIDPFTLLRHMGEDAPGSVQVVPEGVTPSSAGALSELSPTDIARRVQQILDDPDHWVDDTDEDESRFFERWMMRVRSSLTKLGDHAFTRLEHTTRAADDRFRETGWGEHRR